MSAAVHTTFMVGGLRCHALEAGSQRLDGGAMFGVVPKPLWSKRIQPDERNRIPLALRCLLIEHPDGLVLIDSGIGNKETEKFRDIYGVENQGTPGPTLLEDAIRAAGHEPADVKWLINTHLHFDHAGGNTRRTGEEVVAAFPGAEYVVQRGELEFAHSTNERTQASYLPANFDPISQGPGWRLLDGDEEVIPGISVRHTPGHVPYHQSVLIQDSGETALYLADLAPTSAHLPLPWIMGYDLEPLVTLETKRSLFAEAAAEQWLLVFEHDPAVISGRAEQGSRGLVLCDQLTVTSS